MVFAEQRSGRGTARSKHGLDGLGEASRKRQRTQTAIPWVSKLKRPSSRVEKGCMKRDQILVFGFTVAGGEVVSSWYALLRLNRVLDLFPVLTTG